MKTRSQITLLIIFFVAFSSNAQQWHTDFSKAIEQANSTQRPILLVFQGSDWCAPCMKLENEIWSTQEFKNYAKDHFVLLKADFPKRKKNALSKEQQKHNNQLAEKYNKSGYFPYVALLDQKGTKIGATGYKKQTPKEFIVHINSFLNK